MPSLTDEIKEFIVIDSASFDTPSEAVEAVMSIFDAAPTRPDVSAYEPKCWIRPAATPL
jgi:hypothetical protein